MVLLVRNDLLTTFRNMFQNEAFSLLDWIVIETTGLADPAPVIQTFYMDKECQEKMRLDSVIAVVDCKHLPSHLMRTPEAKSNSQFTFKKSVTAHGGIPETTLQISFADRILLNKTDLVTKEELKDIIKSINEINPTAVTLQCRFGNVPLDDLLNTKSFDPKQFLKASSLFGTGTSNFKPINIKRDSTGKIIKSRAGLEVANKDIKPIKPVSDVIGTVVLVTEECIDLNKFNLWISEVLQKRGPDIYRMKGILNMGGYNEQFVAHGVHMIFEGERTKILWANKTRVSKLVFIGKNLNKEEFEAGFALTFQE